MRAEAFALVEAVEREHGRLDVLVNAAGIAQTGIPAPDAAFADLSEAEWRRELDVNLMTAVYTTQAALPGMAPARLRPRRDDLVRHRAVRDGAAAGRLRRVEGGDGRRDALDRPRLRPPAA